MADFVLVHGAGTGGWLWDAVAERLRSAGHGVHAPTLRAVGPPVLPDSDEAGLSDHIDQIVALHDVDDQVILVGFSYGGFVVCGAAERLGSRVLRTIYLDAFLPSPNRSFFDLLPEAVRTMVQRTADQFGGGRRIPPAPIEVVGGLGRLEPGVDRSNVEHLLTRRGFQPLRSYTEPFPGSGSPGPRPLFISCTDKPATDPLLVLARRLNEAGWDVRELRTGHFSMLTMPAALTEILVESAKS